MIYSKHNSQVERLAHNFSRSIKLDVKKFCNRELKKLERRKDISPKVKVLASKAFIEIKKNLYKN